MSRPHSYDELRNYSAVARQLGVTRASVLYALKPELREREKATDRATKSYRGTCPSCGGVAANGRPSRATSLCARCAKGRYWITPAGIAALAASEAS